MKLQSLSYLLPFSSFIGFSRAYALADDCTGDTRTKIRTAVEAAFARIELATKELGKVTTNNNPNADVKNAAGYLFDSGDLAGILTNMESSLHARYNLDLDIEGFQNRWVPGNDILFYCTEGNDRYGPAGKNKVYANKEFLIEASKDFVEGCFRGKSVQAFTLVATENDNVPSLVQLCPWHYDKFINPPPADAEDDKKKPAFIKALGKLADKIAFSHKTQADLPADLVHTIAHEISHTRPGGTTDDSGKKDIASVIGKFLFNLDGYGWFNCVRLKSNHNADSHAFFSTMVNVIVNTGQRPNEKGDMEPIPGWAPAAARRLLRALRSLPSRLDFRALIASKRKEISP